MAARRCIECGRITKGTRCPDCTSAHQRARNQRRTHYDKDWVRLSQQARAAHPWCAQCGSTTDLTLDHVTPRSLADGVRVLCRSCNASKGNRTHGEGGGQFP